MDGLYHMHIVPVEEGIKIYGNVVSGGCELPCWCWKRNLGSLQELCSYHWNISLAPGVLFLDLGNSDLGEHPLKIHWATYLWYVNVYKYMMYANFLKFVADHPLVQTFPLSGTTTIFHPTFLTRNNFCLWVTEIWWGCVRVLFAWLQVLGSSAMVDLA